MAKCGAKTKSGQACKAAAVGKTGRCLFHGAGNRSKRGRMFEYSPKNGKRRFRFERK